MATADLHTTAQLSQALKQELDKHRANLDQCKQYLTQLKINLAQLSLLDASSANPEALALARDVLEMGAYWSIRAGDISAFERYIAQLNPFYYDICTAQLPSSPRRYPLIGLNLLRLLTQSRIADFHTALEMIDPTELRTNQYIQHPLQLEQSLMEGSYKKVWNSRAEVPAPEYTFFMDILTSTIRNEIASCIEKAYTALPAGNLATLLFFPKADDELLHFCQERSWRIDSASRKVHFGQSDATKEGLPVDQIITQSLTYAKELEKIV
ncbi:regulatory particle non-ATPase [Dimargaris xerosporica]|nr:regulatory particle non-ATPase [Dimargaris xerosporica]